MKILVTGASGFLGRHVVRRLQQDGFDVTGFDLVKTDDQELRFITGDLRDAEQVSAAVLGNDVVCHIGAIGDVYLAAEQPSLAAEVNVGGTSHIADAAVAAGARVVYASTWEVYGDVHYEPIDEDHPRDPDHPYNITKLGGESMLLAAGRLRDLSMLALRLGTAYGSGLRPNSVFRLFIDRARRGEPIKILGDGLQSRQFVHASDIARAFSMACVSDATGMALNTVAEEPISIKELAEAVVARFPTQIEHGPSRPGDVPPALISSRRIGEVLGWKPRVSFTEGLSELMESVTDQV
ncbi:MAG: NAD-dependent epimerase/dehydratase family protein [Acidimicrobiia bacterium]